MDTVEDGMVVPAEGSLEAFVRAGRAAGQHRQTKDFEVPGYGGRLWVTYRALDDYADVRAIVKAHEKVADEVTQELYIAADTLIAASVDTFALRDGEKHPLGVGLGLALAQFLDLTDAENDRQAVFQIFPSTLSVMAQFGEVDQWFKNAGLQTDAELEGNSEAPS